ncbi:hypothetical protein AW736_17990 [Termitidicoccus mucosus]|uniref:Uncharacterized protein n=1 Tax=Termitidicoccus mucosus TaxID=1184151 RepID=A0A178IGI1_9BACT|nr:hypothetical protein AW736_17990 [Opitutaceae bacterium TSB47]
MARHAACGGRSPSKPPSKAATSRRSWHTKNLLVAEFHLEKQNRPCVMQGLRAVFVAGGII